MGTLLMHFHRATKPAGRHLGIVGLTALALALAIGASGAILSASGRRPMPFLCDEIAEAAIAVVDSTDSATLLDSPTARFLISGGLNSWRRP